MLSAARFKKVNSKYTTILDEDKFKLPEHPLRTRKKVEFPKANQKNCSMLSSNTKNTILHFAKRSEVPFRNNQAKTEIPMAKVHQEISGTCQNPVRPSLRPNSKLPAVDVAPRLQLARHHAKRFERQCVSNVRPIQNKIISFNSSDNSPLPI